MNTEPLVAELKSVDTLVADGIITPEKGAEWKSRIIAKFEGDVIPDINRKEIPGDIAHLPGRLVGGIIQALSNINPERCAGVAPEQQNRNRQTRPPTLDDLPEQYK
jgi:hypothetical protein